MWTDAGGFSERIWIDKMKDPFVSKVLPPISQVMSKSLPVRVHTIATLVQEDLSPHLQI